jgi:hypothetical protein
LFPSLPSVKNLSAMYPDPGLTEGSEEKGLYRGRLEALFSSLSSVKKSVWDFRAPALPLKGNDEAMMN